MKEWVPSWDDREFIVKVSKHSGKGLGVDVDLSDGTTLRIHAIRQDGLFKDWNDENGFDVQVMSGDKIVEVNGLRGNSEALLEFLTQDDVLELAIANGQAKTFLKYAISSGKVTDLRCAIQQGKQAELSEVFLQRAETALQSAIIEEQPKATSLEYAISSGEVTALLAAIRQGKQAELSEVELQRAETVLAEKEAEVNNVLEYAISSRKLTDLRAAIEQGEQAELSEVELQRAKTALFQEEASSNVWLVEWNGGVNIRESEDVSSDLLGSKNHGEIVFGEAVGDWIRLTDEPGFILKRKSEGEVILRAQGKYATHQGRRGIVDWDGRVGDVVRLKWCDDNTVSDVIPASEVRFEDAQAGGNMKKRRVNNTATENGLQGRWKKHDGKFTWTVTADTFSSSSGKTGEVAMLGDRMVHFTWYTSGKVETLQLTEDGRVLLLKGKVCFLRSEYYDEWKNAGQPGLANPGRYEEWARGRDPQTPQEMLITLHVGECTDDGFLPVTLTNLGGDELAERCESPTTLASEFLHHIETDLGPACRRFMLPDGRLLETPGQAQLLSEWLGV